MACTAGAKPQAAVTKTVAAIENNKAKGLSVIAASEGMAPDGIMAIIAFNTTRAKRQPIVQLASADAKLSTNN
jgi:hypothetical protein